MLTVLQGRRGFGGTGRAVPAEAAVTGVPELWTGIILPGPPVLSLHSTRVQALQAALPEPMALLNISLVLPASGLLKAFLCRVQSPFPRNFEKSMQKIAVHSLESVSIARYASCCSLFVPIKNCVRSSLLI